MGHGFDALALRLDVIPVSPLPASPPPVSPSSSASAKYKTSLSMDRRAQPFTPSETVAPKASNERGIVANRRVHGGSHAAARIKHLVCAFTLLRAAPGVRHACKIPNAF
eukprot:scaffold10401_cov65-Phaeocystis_antarctica.AAC.6